jgi:hypothetical protein
VSAAPRTLLVIVLAACGPAHPSSGASSTGSSGGASTSGNGDVKGGVVTGCSVGGTLLGSDFVAKDCTSLVAATEAGKTTTDIFITDFADDCSLLQSNPHALKANAKVLNFHLTTSGALAVGTYTQDGTTLGAQYAVNDSACNPSQAESAASGTVTVSTADASGYSGTFDLHLGSSDHVTGAFNAATCTPTATGGPAECL